ncbi:MAG: hypothetical protein ACLUSP_04805 [Christensenellales bacterium]
MQVLFNMADVAVVGRFGRDGSLGRSARRQRSWRCSRACLGVGGGINAIVARYYGAKTTTGCENPPIPRFL